MDEDSSTFFGQSSSQPALLCPGGRTVHRTTPLLCQHASCHLTGHCRDKSCPTAAPLLRLDEGDLAVRCQLPDDFVEPVLETGREEQEASCATSVISLSTLLHLLPLFSFHPLLHFLFKGSCQSQEQALTLKHQEKTSTHEAHELFYDEGMS